MLSVLFGIIRLPAELYTGLRARLDGRDGEWMDERPRSWYGKEKDHRDKKTRSIERSVH